MYILTSFVRFASAKDDITPAHPLEESLANVSHYALSLAVFQIYHCVCLSLFLYSASCQRRGLEDAGHEGHSRQAHAPQAADGT